MQDVRRRQEEAQQRQQDYEDRQACLRAGYRGPVYRRLLARHLGTQTSGVGKVRKIAAAQHHM